jgi:hypothetical protein
VCINKASQAAAWHSTNGTRCNSGTVNNNKTKEILNYCGAKGDLATVETTKIKEKD